MDYRDEHSPNVVISGGFAMKIIPMTSLLEKVIVNPEEIRGIDKYRSARRAWADILINYELRESKITLPTLVSCVFSKRSNTKSFVNRMIERVQNYDSYFDYDNLRNVLGDDIDTIAWSIRKIIPEHLGGEGITVSLDVKQRFIVIISPVAPRTGVDFAKAVKNPKEISEFLIAVMGKLNHLHEKYKIIHENLKMSHILISERQKEIVLDDITHFPTSFNGDIYFTDFRWAEALEPVLGYNITNKSIWNHHRRSEMVPLISKHNTLDILNRGLDVPSRRHIYPRANAIDIFTLLYDIFTENHLRNTHIQNILHMIYGKFRRCSITDSETRYHGKTDYSETSPKEIGKHILSILDTIPDIEIEEIEIEEIEIEDLSKRMDIE